MNRKDHWEKIYTVRAITDVGWFQAEPRISLELISKLGPVSSLSVIDVGAGASSLVDCLLADGGRDIAALDISSTALKKAQARLGPVASTVQWIEADLLEYSFEQARYDIWHDRAVFHFLTTEEDRARYVAQARRALKPGGHLILATFASDGPVHCSGLDVCRYSPEALQQELGQAFALIDSVPEQHTTPAGRRQSFLYALFQQAMPNPYRK